MPPATTSSPPHRIRRQRWLVRAGSPGDAFALRAYLHDRSQELLEPVLQAAFDAAAGPDTILRLPRLELRVRVASIEDLPRILPGAIADQLREQLAAGGAGATERESDARPDEIPPAQLRWERLRHFLRTGDASWDSAEAPAADIARALRETCSEQKEALQSWIRDAGRATEVWLRLMSLLPEAAIVELAAASVAQSTAVSSSAVLAIVQCLLRDRAAGPAPLRRRVAAVLLGQSRDVDAAPREILASLRSLEVEALIAVLIELPAAERDWLLPDAPRMSEAAMADQSRGSATASSLFAGATDNTNARDEEASVAADPAATLRAGLRRRLGGTAAPVVTSRLRDAAPGAAAHAGDSTPSTEQRLEKPRIGSTELSEPAVTRLAPAGAEASRIVPCAGLILLHPFLPRLFEHLHIREPDAPGLPAAQLERAAALLHWLATGREERFEFELPFIKVLLGLAPDAPLDAAAHPLAAEDRAEADAMLRAVIEHWTVLRNTSPAGLRTEFLERKGLLREDAGGWHLQVERRALDVLLDRLPWGIGIVRLPWMTKPLFATW